MKHIASLRLQMSTAEPIAKPSRTPPTETAMVPPSARVVPGAAEAAGAGKGVGKGRRLIEDFKVMDG